MQCPKLELFHRLEQSLLFKVVQWKAQYKIIPKLFLPLPFLFLVDPDSQILVLGFRGHLGSIPGLGDWGATIHGVAKTQTGLSD